MLTSFSFLVHEMICSFNSCVFYTLRMTNFLLQYMTEKMGGAEGTKLDVDFVDMERVSEGVFARPVYQTCMCVVRVRSGEEDLHIFAWRTSRKAHDLHIPYFIRWHYYWISKIYRPSSGSPLRLLSIIHHLSKRFLYIFLAGSCEMEYIIRQWSGKICYHQLYRRLNMYFVSTSSI